MLTTFGQQSLLPNQYELAVSHFDLANNKDTKHLLGIASHVLIDYIELRSRAINLWKSLGPSPACTAGLILAVPRNAGLILNRDPSAHEKRSNAVRDDGQGFQREKYGLGRLAPPRANCVAIVQGKARSAKQGKVDLCEVPLRKRTSMHLYSSLITAVLVCAANTAPPGSHRNLRASQLVLQADLEAIPALLHARTLRSQNPLSAYIPGPTMIHSTTAPSATAKLVLVTR